MRTTLCFCCFCSHLLLTLHCVSTEDQVLRLMRWSQAQQSYRVNQPTIKVVYDFLREAKQHEQQKFSLNHVLSWIFKDVNATEWLPRHIFSQVGFSNTSPKLSDDSRFPLYSRTCPSETLNNFAIVNLLKHFNWKRVAILVQQDHIFTKVRLTKEREEELFL